MDINSGCPGMEGVPGGTSSESQAPCEGTPLVECRFFSFSCILILFACHSANVPNVFFGNCLENLKMTIHQRHRSRWISACNGATGYDRTFSSGCKSVRTILYFLL